MRRTKRTRGFVLVDYITGTLILSGTLLVFFTLTSTKFKLLDSGEMRTRALSSVEAEIDRIRLEGLKTEPKDRADVDGFRPVSTFEPKGRLTQGKGVVEARALRMKAGAGDPQRLFEVRVTVRWRDTAGYERLTLSTVATLPKTKGTPR